MREPNQRGRYREKQSNNESIVEVVKAKKKKKKGT